MRQARETSSGGVVYRKLRGRLVVALCRRWGGRIWCLPKGIIDPGEENEEAALREVLEETGIRGRILRRLGEIRYRYVRPGRGGEVQVAKRVTFYLMLRIGGNITQHDHEVERVRWFPLREAVKKATFPGERAMIGKAAERLRSTSV